MTLVKSILTVLNTMESGDSIRTVKLGLISCLLLVVTLMSGCEGDNKDAAQNNTSNVTEPLSSQAWVDPKAARIDTLKARLFDDPNSELLLSDLGDAYFESQRFQEAIPIYEKAATINPQNPDVLNDLGLSYYYTGKAEQGLDTVNRAIEVDPAYKFAWLSKGFILTSLGKHDEAITSLNKVKELDPGGPQSRTADDFLKEIEISLNRGTEGSD
jgi:tetratricopeptide (TPR) repeat protein